jgi:hypothetical protein
MVFNFTQKWLISGLIQGSAKAGHLGRLFGPDVAQRLGKKSLDPAKSWPSLAQAKKVAQRLGQAQAKKVARVKILAQAKILAHPKNELN